MLEIAVQRPGPFSCIKPHLPHRLRRWWWGASQVAVQRRLHRDQRGLVILLWSVGMLGIMGFLAVVVEAGFIFAERRDLQTAADAGALAGAQALWWDGDAVADGQLWASKNIADLVGNGATVVGPAVTVTVSKNASSLFEDGHWLSFGNPLVSATATARLGTTVVPGPGVFCIGVEATSLFGIGFDDAYTYQQSFSLPGPAAPPPLVLTPNGFYTVMRTGTGAGSNAGYVDIDLGGGGANEVRDCMAEGSSGALAEEIDPQGDYGVPIGAEPGIDVGPSRQGLQDRLEAAMAEGCYSWADIRQSMLDADQNGDGVVDAGSTWRCSPLNPALTQNGVQATAIVILPIIADQFKFSQIQGGSETFWVAKCEDPAVGCDADDDGDDDGDDDADDDQPYQLAFFWLDGESTFADTSKQNWQYISSTGQGQAEIWGVFLIDNPLSLEPPPASGARVVACNRDSRATLGCFLQLVE